MEAVFLRANHDLRAMLDISSSSAHAPSWLHTPGGRDDLDLTNTATMQSLEAVARARRDELTRTREEISAVEQDNATQRETITRLSHRLHELEGLFAVATASVANSLTGSDAQRNLISLEGELSSLRAEVRALESQRSDLQLQREALDKTLQRKQIQLLDESAENAAKLAKLQASVDDESNRSHTLQRHVVQREDCGSMLVTMKARAAELRTVMHDYDSQNDRLLQDYESMCLLVAEQREALAAVVTDTEKDVDRAAEHCRKLEAELRQQLLATQSTIREQRTKIQRDVDVMREAQAMTQAENRDLQRDIETLHNERAALERMNTELSHNVSHHEIETMIVSSSEQLKIQGPTARYADKGTRHQNPFFMPEEPFPSRHRVATANWNSEQVDQDRWIKGAYSAAPGARFEDGGDSFIIRTQSRMNEGDTLPMRPSEVLSTFDADAQRLLLELRVEVGVLEKELQKSQAEKDVTAELLDQFVAKSQEESTIRKRQLEQLRSDLRHADVHGELKAAKLEHFTLLSIVQERVNAEESSEEEVAIGIASLSGIIQELKSRIIEISSTTSEKERMLSEQVQHQRDMVKVAQAAYELAHSTALRDQERLSKFHRLQQENEKLKQFFRDGNPVGLTR